MKLILIILAVSLSSSCATYKDKDKGITAAGYEERKTAEGLYWLRFDGHGLDSHEKLEAFWYQRADELCGIGNYTANPERKTQTASTVGVSGYAAYQNNNNFPYIEGSVECTDKLRAVEVGPGEYNYLGIAKYSIGTIKGASEEIQKNTLKSLNFDLENALLRNNMVADEAALNKNILNITITRFRMRGAATTEFIGVFGVLGGLTGSDSIESIISISKPDVVGAISEETIKTSNWSGGPSRGVLMRMHSDDIIEYLQHLE